MSGTDPRAREKLKLNNHMKTCSFRQMAYGAGRAALLLGQAPIAHSQVSTYDVDVQSPHFTLYTDPYNGNQIKVGCFSGLFPVPRRPDTFYTITVAGRLRISWTPKDTRSSAGRSRDSDHRSSPSGYCPTEGP